MKLIHGAAIAVLVGLLALAWAFIGVERLVGDHEIGVSWEPFIKHTPTWRIRFENPVQKGLDLVPIASLATQEQQRLVEFCEIRFGQPNAQQCYEHLSARLR